MARKVVSKLTYYSFTIFFHSLCLSGLIWQITQISVNFFQYDVLTDIKIFTPEESKWCEKVAYVCFWDHELKNAEKLAELNVYDPNTLTIGQRFETRLTSDQIFFYVHGFERKYAFIVSNNICFQFQFKSDETSIAFHEQVANVSYFWLAIGHESNNYDESRRIPATTNWINNSQVFEAKSNSFKILKMLSPYSDHCFNYSDIGLRDRNDAIATCGSSQTHVSPNKVVRETDVKFFNSFTNWTGHAETQRKCAMTHVKPDCNQRLFLTRLTTEVSYHSAIISAIYFAKETDASFSVISKPKIDDIDYVTYILCALGSWIGFSFIGINPIPHLFQMPGAAKVTHINHNICKSRYKQIKLELVKKTKEINTNKQTIAQIVSYLESQVNQS